ncbi:hypothetical protein CY34DRAFT_805402 [Suillus luteus UH-Slu-Lm8-n1]|uniref:Uncharacterized protein n=1 Tax=Suillus luteus UH-Slu-Lm8-n1 TaxID=930992 RepID=A0A0D0B6F9_9AGAM|nr:hypothetical protein CY34DRAFT_805402 [Suillus luteus UH-Slu-Lm8-n1]
MSDFIIWCLGAEKTETQLEYSAFWCLLGQVTTSAPKDAGRLAREFLKGQEDSWCQKNVVIRRMEIFRANVVRSKFTSTEGLTRGTKRMAVT